MFSLPDIAKEFTYYAVRSSGKGGQNVNKTATKVEVYFAIADSILLNDDQKTILLSVLKDIIHADGNLRITCEEARSQAENKKKATQKMIALITKALTPKKKRVPTKKTKAANEKRLEEKRKQAVRKSTRRSSTSEE